MTSRWSRTFSNLATFSDDLGDLGSSVVDSAAVPREDIVLRRLLIAQKRAGVLKFPFEIHAQHGASGAPHFVVKDTDGRRYLQVADARQIEPCANDGDPRDLVAYYPEGAMEASAVADGRVLYPAGNFAKVHVVDGNVVDVDANGPGASRVDVRDDYDMDLCRWTESQTAALRQREWDRLDVENLIEELNALARRDRRTLKSRLETLFAHLLKWQHQPAARSRSWPGTIHENCTKLDDLLTESPSLRKQLDPQGDEVATAYRRARTQASNDTGLGVREFPEAFPWSADLAEVARGARSLEAVFGSPEDEVR